MPDRTQHASGARLVESGVLDLDAPVARYWPGFAQAGKVRILLRHLPTQPWWEPGSGHGYHVNTQGFLVGEVVRRVTGRTPGAYLRERSPAASTGLPAGSTIGRAP